MKKTGVFGFVLTILMLFSSCASHPSSQVSATMPEIVSISGTEEGVADFQKLQGQIKTGYDEDTCYNITPREIGKSSDYRIFKYTKSCATYLQYDGGIYQLGEWFGGYGVTCMKLADLNDDGQQELYFTCSWGSGIHRAQIGCFDSADKEVKMVDDYSDMDGELMLVSSDSGLQVYRAEIRLSDFVTFEMVPTAYIGDLAFSEGKIQLKQVQDSE